MNPPKKKNYQTLRGEWYRKLAASGFEDIETQNHALAEWHSVLFRKEIAPPNGIVSRESVMESRNLFQEAKSNYYRLAGQFLHSFHFETVVCKIIWSEHCEGNSITEIAKLLRKKRVTVPVNEIKRRIQKLRKIMMNK